MTTSPVSTELVASSAPPGRPTRLALLRSKRRGAAMTEAAVFLPLFAIMFTGMGFVAHLYVGKLNAMRFARSYAWQHAVKNCEGQTPPRDPSDKGEGNASAGSGASTVSGGNEPLDPNGSQGEPVGTSAANGDSDVNTLTKDMPDVAKSGANTSAKSTGKVKFSGAGWAPTANVESSTKMMCNEPRTKTGILEVIGRALKLFNP